MQIELKKWTLHAKDAEIGYLLTTDNWARGIMTNAVSQMCELLFHKLDIIRITGNVSEPTIGSCRVLEKNGFVLEGLLKNAVYKNNQISNLCIYGKYRPL